MLRRVTRRFVSSLMHASATPHNELTVAEREGRLTTRSSLILQKEQEIEIYVLNLFKNYFRTAYKGNLSVNSTLGDHGLDSLDAVELVVRIEDELGYVIPGEALRCFSTVRSFINYIKQTEDFKKEFNKAPIN